MRSFFVALLLLLLGTASLAMRLPTSGRQQRAQAESAIRSTTIRGFASTLLGGALVWGSGLNAASARDQFQLPPIDRNDKTRCTMVSSTIGQANGARDKLIDFRECNMAGQTADGKDMSGMIALGADFSGISFREAQISKANARNSKFVGCDFTNSVSDRVSFDGADLSKAVFANAVLTGTSFVDANLKDTDFTDAYIGSFDLKALCLNPTLEGTNPTTKVDTRESVGCP